MKPFTPDLSLDAEIQAVAAFIAPRWESVDNLPEVVRIVQEAAFHDSRASIDQLDVGAFVGDIVKRRDSVIEGLYEHPVEKDYASSYDSLNGALASFLSTLRYIGDVGLDVDGRWDFETKVRAAKRRAESKFPAIAKAKPLNWKNYKAQYEAGEIKPDYSFKAEKEAFTGSSFELARSYSLPEMLALHSLVYDEQEQGRKVGYMLFSAIYGHFSNIQHRLITHQLKVEIDQAMDWDIPVHMFEKPVFKVSSNPLFNILAEDIRESYTETEFKDSVAHRIRHDALSEAEKEAVKSANREKLKQEMGPDYWKEMDARVAQKKDEIKKAMKKVFSSAGRADLDGPSL